MNIKGKIVTKNLDAIIDAQIKTAGPISLSTYMGLCLTHPELGYYKNADPLGAEGDFITAPEISQMFGEFIGLFIAQCWQDMGAPNSFDLVELGPGRGTLLQDAFRVLNKVDGLIDAMQLNLLETSPTLRNLQKQKLGAYNPIWIDEIAQLKSDDKPLIIIANEFFDALPIKQFQKQDDKWHERAIGLKGGKREFGLTPSVLPSDSLPPNIREAENGSVWEVSFSSLRLMGEIAALIAKRGGAFLAIDYGYAKSQTGETFQAVKKHEFVDPLLEPGLADLTAHVDFEALATVAKNAGAKPHTLMTQGEFLVALGIEQRSAQLMNANPALSDEITSARNRLIAKDQMGELFKALCISSKNLAPLPFGSE